MWLVVIALIWVALLAPMAVRRLRDNGTERSIESFHAEHEVLSRQGYTVSPAHRLSEPDEAPRSSVGARPRLTVVHDDDTYRSLESRGSWEEWSEGYDYDRKERPPVNRYAAAYASVPRAVDDYDRHEAPLRRRTARAQRQMIFTRTALSAVVMTTLALVVGSSILVDLAIVTWVALAGYVALALYAVSQGYLHESSLGIKFARSRPLATVEPLYGEYEGGYEEDVESEFYEPAPDGQWRRDSSRYALG